MIPILITIAFVLLVVWSYDYTVNYWTHKFMTRSDVKCWGYGTFQDFKREFYKVQWSRDKKFPESFFSDENFNSDYIHASVIKFGGRGMVLYYPSFIRYRWFLRKHRVKTSKGLTIVW